MITNSIRKDKQRGGDIPMFQYTYRWYKRTNNKVLKLVFKAIHRYVSWMYKVEMPVACSIGDGLYIGHPYLITLNSGVKIGNNCNIHKGVTIGRENRGRRNGVPVLGDCVWVGVNATIVGAIKIGNDVLIAPNSFVNHDIPDHSIVIGNPCVVKHCDKATEGYINNII